MQPFYYSTKCAQNITVTVSVRVSVTVRVSLVLFVIGNVKCRHLPSIAKVTVSANNISRKFMPTSWMNLPATRVDTLTGLELGLIPSAEDFVGILRSVAGSVAVNGLVSAWITVICG